MTADDMHRELVLIHADLVRYAGLEHIAIVGTYCRNLRRRARRLRRGLERLAT